MDSLAPVPVVEDAPSRVRSAREVLDGMNERYGPDGGLTPYVIIRMLGDRQALTDLPADLRGRVATGLRDAWTIAKVAGMSTEAIVAELARIGLPFNEAGFRKLAQARSSAWTISDVWRARGRACEGQDEDFAGLAACELWKRLLPERPSIELIDDWMQEGYDLFAKKQTVEAAETWWKVWQTLLPRFTPDMRTERSTEAVFSGYQYLGNWRIDLGDALWNASLKDSRFVLRGRQFCEEWCAQFTDEDAQSQVNVRRQLAGFLLRAGEADAAERCLVELVERYPTSPWSYVALADACGHLFPEMGALTKDVARAVACLKRGILAVPGKKERDVLLERLELLQAHASSDAHDLA